jgi:DNA-binding transcriptional LysR family regulator
MYDVDTAFLRTFVKLAETGSFSKAGALVGRSQSAVSGQIRKLEETFQRQLLERDTRGVRLTPDGEALLAHAREMIAAADAMLSRFRGQAMAGEVRFGSPEDFATAFLPDILARFAAAHPDVELHVSCALTLDLIRSFEAGEHDIVVLKQAPGRVHPGARALFSETLVWVGPPDELLPTDFAEAVRLFAARGRGLPLVMAPAPCVYRARALEALEGAGARWSSTYSSPSLSGVVAAVRAGLGYAVVPKGLVPPGLSALTDWPEPAGVELCILHQARVPPVVEALADFVALRMRDRSMTAA